jgi:DUF4097 and DUF4098 domain-containing protein YvlB
MRTRGTVAGPLVLIIIGAIFLLRQIQPGFPLIQMLGRYWPYFLILWGTVALVEVCVRFIGNRPLPANGVSGGGWFFVVMLCLAGMSTFEFGRPDRNWFWNRSGFMQGVVDGIGEEHQFSVEPSSKPVGAAPHIVIESFRGDAKITGTDSHEVAVSGEKSVRTMENGSADAANAAARVELVTEGNTVVVKCHQERANSDTPVTTNLQLLVPKGASVEMVGTRGDLDVTGIAGDVTLSSENAGVRLQDIGGQVRVETRRSDLIRCENIKGDLDLRGRGDDVDLVKVGGQVTISGDYRGSVSLRELAKQVRVSNTHTQFDVQEIPGEVRLDRGSFNAQNVVGPVKLQTHSTDVTMDGFTAGLELTVDRGDIEIRPNHVPVGRMVVHATSGNIELSLPEDAKFEMNATTRRGEIENDFGEILKTTSEGHGAKLEGTVGSGPDLSLETTHGTITVRKATESSEPSKVKEKAEDGEASVRRAVTVASLR